MEKVEVKELKGMALEVKEILESFPRARDENWSLIFSYAFKHTDIKEVMDTCYFPARCERILSELAKINVESLTRAKRKVQELYPELRGEKRKERERRQEIFIEFNRQRKQDLEDFWEDSEEDEN